MECSICLCEITYDTCYQLTCNHQFHDTCLKSWISNENHRSCPLCRKDIDSYVITQLDSSIKSHLTEEQEKDQLFEQKKNALILKASSVLLLSIKSSKAAAEQFRRQLPELIELLKKREDTLKQAEITQRYNTYAKYDVILSTSHVLNCENSILKYMAYSEKSQIQYNQLQINKNSPEYYKMDQQLQINEKEIKLYESHETIYPKEFHRDN